MYLNYDEEIGIDQTIHPQIEKQSNRNHRKYSLMADGTLIFFLNFIKNPEREPLFQKLGSQLQNSAKFNFCYFWLN